MGSGRL